MTLSDRSRKNLVGVHPHLVAVVEKAAGSADFLVTEGVRTLERQKMLKAAGKSKTLDSRHLTGHAVDICDCDGCYDVPDLQGIAKAMKAAADELGVKIAWGGDWKWKDMPHFELDQKTYPAQGVSTATKALEAIKTKTGAAVAAGGGTIAVPQIPAPPDLGWATAWQTSAETASSLGSWAWNNPALTAALIVWIALSAFAPQLVSRFTPASPS